MSASAPLLVDPTTLPLFPGSAKDPLRYLTIQAQPIMRDFSARLLQGGQHTLLPNDTVRVAPVPVQ
jgi:hypothetical protein